MAYFWDFGTPVYLYAQQQPIKLTTSVEIFFYFMPQLRSTLNNFCCINFLDSVNVIDVTKQHTISSSMKIMTGGLGSKDLQNPLATPISTRAQKTTFIMATANRRLISTPGSYFDTRSFTYLAPLHQISARSKHSSNRPIFIRPGTLRGRQLLRLAYRPLCCHNTPVIFVIASWPGY